MNWLGDLNMNISKITGGADNQPKTRNESTTPNSPMASPEVVAKSDHSDQVRLSASSKSIQQIEAEINAMPEVNDATVERIRSAIENGDYKIDYEKLAGKMLDFEEHLN